MRDSFSILFRLAVLLCALGREVSAQSSEHWVPGASAFIVAPDTVPHPGLVSHPLVVPKSAGTAVTISVLSTYGPVALALATKNSGVAIVGSVGVLVGPSTGYWYAGSPAWSKGMIFRVVMMGVGTGGALLSSPCFLNEVTASCEAGALIALASGAAIVIDGIVDIAKLPKAVHTENAARLSLSPTVAVDGRSMGLNVSMKF